MSVYINEQISMILIDARYLIALTEIGKVLEAQSISFVDK